MNIKNFLKPSDYVMFVPNGIPVTIQYGEQGIIQKFFLDWNCNRLANGDVATALTNLSGMGLFPNTIPIKNGTSWVKGILVADSICKSEGTLPACAENELISMLASGNLDGWHFYAGNVESRATTFGGAHPTLNWLKMNKFTVLPSKLVPVNPDADSFSTTWGEGYTLDESAMLFVYSNGKFEVKSLDRVQFIVKTIDLWVDEYGVIKYIVKSADDKYTKLINYSDAVQHSVTTNSLVLFDGTRLLKSTRLDKHRRKTPTLETSCPVCGRKLTAGIGQELICTDLHCKSKWYPQICHMLKTFNLPEISFAHFNVIKDKLVCLADVLDDKDCCAGTVKISLGRLLEGIIPQRVVRNPQILHEFANKCNNDISQFRYYISNPDKLDTDFKFVSNFAKEFRLWLSDTINQSEVSALLDHNLIEIIDCDKSFDGPPIFRNKVICLTGKFNHGDYNKIANILQSYGAKVEYRMSSETNGLLVGDILEKVNGHYIQICKNNGIPVMSEGPFFAQYEIDKDLATHLV